jgi:hypothetical protein
MSKLIYQDVHTNEFSDSDVWDAINADDVEALKLLPIKLGFSHENWRFVQDISVKLSEHPNEDVRGNSFRGLAYTAMNLSKLEKNIVKPVLLRGLKDESDWVKMCAQEALDDINQYLGWKIGSAKANKEREKRYDDRLSKNS